MLNYPTASFQNENESNSLCQLDGNLSLQLSLLFSASSEKCQERFPVLQVEVTFLQL